MGKWQGMTGNEESTHALLMCYLWTEDLETLEMDLKNKDRCKWEQWTGSNITQFT